MASPREESELVSARLNSSLDHMIVSKINFTRKSFIENVLKRDPDDKSGGNDKTIGNKNSVPNFDTLYSQLIQSPFMNMRYESRHLLNLDNIDALKCLYNDKE